MKTISITYPLVFRFKNHHNLQVTKCGKIFNIKTGRQKKMCYNGGSIGIWIDTKTFITKSTINSMIEPKPYNPFFTSFKPG